MYSFKGFFRSQLVSVLAENLSNAAEQGLNKALNSNPPTIPIGDLGIQLNYTLLSNPVVTEDYFSMAFDGTFYHPDSQY